MTVLIISCHPDDAEFMMTGTALLLKQAGCQIHYITIANGSAGSATMGPAQIVKVRRAEAMKAAALLGAVFHESLVDDLEVFYTQELIRQVTALVRRVMPDIVLTQSLEDYMEDHMNAGRIAVTATFLRGVQNYRSVPHEPAILNDVMLYHATPHILTDQLRRPIVPEMYVDISSVIEEKEKLLVCHESQKDWLDATQGFDSYVRTMRDAAQTLGRMSGRYVFAEGWRRHSHVGFSRKDSNPIADLLAERCLMRPAG
ncbi:MAG TPA: PIG-L deacetylase family protein [Spirochaetia bacterium]|nr:PIG-L deacetylase family protein [Spirochaetia bacterium]